MKFIILLAFVSCKILEDVILKPKQVQILTKEAADPTSGTLTKISVNGFPYIRQSYISNVLDSRVDFTFRHAYLRIVEYNDSVSIQDSTSKCIFNDENFQWFPFNFTEIKTEESLVRNYSTTFIGRKDCLGLKVGFDTFITGNNTKLSIFENTTPVSLFQDKPRHVLRITDYPFKLRNSKLALVSAIFSEKSREKSNNEIKSIPNNIASANVSFNTFSILGNRLFNVSISDLVDSDGSGFARSDDGSLASESYNLIYIKFDQIQPQSIYWDSSLSIEILTSNSWKGKGKILFFFLIFLFI